MKNELLLLSGADIPFIEGTLIIHQPTIYEISMIGEEALFAGCELLKFSKDILEDQDKINLSDQTDFNILMSIMNDKSASMQNSISYAEMVLDLLFPYYVRKWVPTAGILMFGDAESGAYKGKIDSMNFPVFKDILASIFCLQHSDVQEYNAQDELAKKIAEKFQKRKQKLASLSSKPEKIAIFSKYISILTVGEHKDMNSFMKYTVYQLFDEFQRFQLKMANDYYMQARLAGASEIKEPEDWMQDIHSGK